MYEYLLRKVQVMGREYGVWKTEWFRGDGKGKEGGDERLMSYGGAIEANTDDKVAIRVRERGRRIVES